ncbi:Urb2/Npa2 family-domain-containing protein [Aspergillus granulosus]|uniref:Urb2/Npa2 family-domain-containing protein n=1 Tax=Aspergillus granulosus TaxID=176169 RepID=A0ABR4I5P9_9EURO
MPSISEVCQSPLAKLPSYSQTVQRPRSSQEALLQLEKGTASPSTQLNEAAQIIGLDLSLCASHPEINRAPHTPIHAAPKEEWVLRWLLKKLKAGKNYRVEPASFLLLRQLIDLIPPKTLGSTLKDQKFLGVVEHAIADLTDDVFTGLGDGTADSSPSESESSRTLSESSRTNEGLDKKGTKRKRARENAQDTMDIDEQPRTPASCYLTFTRILDCLYSLVTLSNRVNGANEAASSHIRHALRGEPQQAATTLGKSLTLASVAISQFCHGRKTTELQHLFYVLPALFEVWEWRSHRQDDSDQSSSNESFATHCCQSALRLLHCVRASQLDTDERTQVLHGVERLIALHVVLPARTGFLSRGGSGIDYSSSEPDWSSVQPITDTFRPILCTQELLNQDEAKSRLQWNTADLIPDFFAVATRSVARDTFRRKTDEEPWLETLFVAVAELAFSLVKAEGGPTFMRRFVNVLEQLFRIALKWDVRLSLHTLLTHARYTGLLKEGLSEVEWSLTALLIELGADVFLPNSGLADSNKFLEALLNKILLRWQSGVSSDSNNEVIKTGIILPLLRGFTGARDIATFMEIWYQQLGNVEAARLRDDNLGPFTVWEDDDLCNAFGDLLRNPLHQNLAATQMRAAAAEIRGGDGHINTSEDAYGQIVILESGLRKQAINLASTNPVLESVLSTVIPALSSDQVLHWRWRLWKLVRSLVENNTHKTDAGIGADLMNLTGAATKTIRRYHQESTSKLSARLECIEAYQFILATMKRTDDGEGFPTVMKEATDFIKTISTKNALRSMSSPWDGRSETIDSPTILGLAYFLTLVRNPGVWGRFESEVRRSLFGHILSLATAQYQPSSSTLESPASGAHFLQAWSSIISHEYLLNTPLIVNDLITVISKRVNDDPPNRKLYIESLQRIPASLITRRQRGAMLDLLQGVVLQQDSNPIVTVGILSLMARLADMSKTTAELTGNWEPIWNLAKAITLQGTDVDLDIMKAFRFLHRAVIAKLLLLAEGDRRKLFKKMYRKISTKVTKLQSLDPASMECFFLRISLSQLWQYRTQVPDAIEGPGLTSSRERMFELVVADVRSAKDQCKKQPLEETISLIKTLDALEDFEDLATNHVEIRKFLAKIENYVGKSADPESALRRHIRRRVLATQGLDKSVTAPIMQYAESLPLQQLYTEQQQLFIKATTDRFRSMSAATLLRVIQEVHQLGFLGKNAEYHLLIAGLAISAAPSTEDRESDQAKELSLVCTAIIEAVSQSKSHEEFVLATECLDVLLRSHPRCISQWNVDSLLSCIAVCASRSGPRISSEFSGMIYTRLCRLLGLLLGLHRQKIGGRFHLVLLPMQRLLHCLFARVKKSSTRLARSDTGNTQQPPWLAQLDATHATHYTRLLTSLCDPTVSAVSRPTLHATSHEGLTDQTKKAKRIAGQYLQYLIIDYAQSTLRNTLSPDVKAALLPGLYSALDAMSRETMRALNAGLDISGRAVFKVLYDDYMRFGRWNKG